MERFPICEIDLPYLEGLSHSNGPIRLVAVSYPKAGTPDFVLRYVLVFHCYSELLGIHSNAKNIEIFQLLVLINSFT